MITLALYRPKSKSILRIAPAPVVPAEPWDLAIGLPNLTDQQGAYSYGFANGREGWKPLIPDTTPLDLIDWIWEGYDAGQAERQDAEAAAAILESGPTDAEIAEGIAPWADLPSPDELAAGLRTLLSRIDGEDAASEFARLALASLAGDVELFDARSFAEVQARDFEMAATAFQCRECGGGAR